jgi:hypothetical protein
VSTDRVTKTVHPADGFTLSTIAQDKKGREEYVRQRYIGYSDREARAEFKAYLEERGLKAA